MAVEKENTRGMKLEGETPPVLTDEEVDNILEKGVNFDHKPSSEAEVHRQIQRDADVRFYRGKVQR